jgi:hypothetical protein
VPNALSTPLITSWGLSCSKLAYHHPIGWRLYTQPLIYSIVILPKPLISKLHTSPRMVPIQHITILEFLGASTIQIYLSLYHTNLLPIPLLVFS